MHADRLKICQNKLLIGGMYDECMSCVSHHVHHCIVIVNVLENKTRILLLKDKKANVSDMNMMTD